VRVQTPALENLRVWGGGIASFRAGGGGGTCVLTLATTALEKLELIASGLRLRIKIDDNRHLFSLHLSTS